MGSVDLTSTSGLHFRFYKIWDISILLELSSHISTSSWYKFWSSWPHVLILLTVTLYGLRRYIVLVCMFLKEWMILFGYDMRVTIRIWVSIKLHMVCMNWSCRIYIELLELFRFALFRKRWTSLIIIQQKRNMNIFVPLLLRRKGQYQS